MVVSTTSAQNPSGRISFQVPMNKPTMYLPNQWYLMFDLSITGTNTNYVFFNAGRDASALIRKITVSIGGVVVETIDHYHHLYASLMNHTASFGFRNNDLKVLSAAGAPEGLTADNLRACIGQAEVAGGVVAQNNLIVPLMVGCLNSKNGIPAFLLNAPMVIDIELNPINECLLAATNASPPVAGTAPTNYTVSNTKLMFNEVVLDDAFVNRVRSDMSAGKVYQITHSTWLNTQIAGSATISQLYGVNFASLNGVFWNAKPAASATAYVPYKAGDVSATAANIAGLLTKFDVYLDGRRVLQHDCNNTQEAYSNLQRSLGILWDNQYAACKLVPRGASSAVGDNVFDRLDYASFSFWAGQSTRRYLDYDLSFEGSACQTIQIDVNRTHAAGDLIQFYFNYDQVISIDVNGQVQVNK
jgi:hypothetical protein